MDNKGQRNDLKALTATHGATGNAVLDKTIFNKVFQKDVRRVFIYKKADRIAKALNLISPAFRDTKAMRERIERLSVSLIDAAALPIPESKEVLSRELLALLSFLSMARMNGRLSPMNADIITREAQGLLHDIAVYEDQQISLPEIPTLAELAKTLPERKVAPKSQREVSDKGQYKGQESFNKTTGSRRDTVLSILRSKGPSDIKDISTVIQGVSEKTIQRELQALVSDGTVLKTGKRRWTTYKLAAS